MPESFHFGGGASATVLSPAALAAMVVAIALILWLPRKHAIIPLLAFAFLVPLGEQIYVGGIHLFLMRIVLLVGCVRMLLAKFSSKTSILAGGFNSIDKAFTLWAVFRGVAVVLQWESVPALINQAGFWWDVFGAYFLLRYLIQDDEDIQRTVKTLAAITGVVAVGVIYEHYHMANAFGRIFGGIRMAPEVRDGRIRCQGSFQHPILAGCFAATLAPLFLWLWVSGKSKALAVLGLFSSMTMVWFAAASTPVMAFLGAPLGVFLWPIRKRMRMLRWGIVISILGLALVMKAPVWFVIAHVNVTGASSGSDRAYLIDNCVRHFSDWWLLGIKNPGNWGSDMWDLSNQFVAEAETGGLATLVCFLAMISLGFKKLGLGRKSVEGDRKQEWFLWLLGCALFCHILAFFGISYFDHTQIAWFALFAMICAAFASREAQQKQEESSTNQEMAELESISAQLT
ncbi:MAG: hypothetical protein KGM47_03230 [Acidobacteriota bacterium]|nr:hypothetical protein [Acidobacteriota bacterium]